MNDTRVADTPGRRGRWVKVWTHRLPLYAGMFLVLDLVGSAAWRQVEVWSAYRETVRAELTQEPYRDTDWGAEYWEEISHYTEKWDPYFVYRVDQMQGRYINVRDGIRDTYTPKPAKSGHRHLIFLFGGSAAWGHGARDLQTLTSWLARVAEEHGESFDVRNYAESGWVNWQGVVYLLQKLADGERPQMVVFNSGVNEVLSHRKWPQVRRPIWGAEFYPRAMSEFALQRHRPLFRVWDYYRGTSIVLNAVLGQKLVFPPVPLDTPDAQVANISSNYSADKAVVEALGRAYGFTTVFVWQSTIADKKTLSAQERRYAGWLPPSPNTRPALDWWSMPADLRELYTGVGADVVSRGDAIDVSHSFDGMEQTAFIDWMHPSESGHERVARALYPELLSRLHEPQAYNPSTSSDPHR